MIYWETLTEKYRFHVAKNVFAESSYGRLIHTAFHIYSDISNPQHFSDSAKNGFLDLVFYLRISKSVSVGAANVLEMFHSAAQVGVNLRQKNDPGKKEAK